MFKLASLFAEVVADDSSFQQTLAKAREDFTGAYEAMSKAAPVKLPSVEGGGGLGAAGALQAGQSATFAAQIAGSFRSAMAPMNQMTSSIAAMVNTVGGTIVELARRIDSAFKFKAMDEALTRLREKLRTQLAQGANAATTALTPLQRIIQRYGPAVQTAVSAFQAFSKAKQWLSSLGDVAGKSLKQITGINFGNTIKQLTSVKVQVTNITRAAGSAHNALSGIASKALAVVGIGAAGFGLEEVFRKSVMGASDLNEALNATKVVFGQSSKSVIDMANEMASKFGLVKSETLEAAAGFGSMFRAGGFTRAKAAEMSATMVKLAADLSSVRNLSMEEALAKIRSGLAGEAEPLRTVGVLLSEDAVKQEAYRAGLAKVGEELTEQQKIVARSAVIQRQLAFAQGDLANTSGDFANQFRQLGGRFQNMLVDLGQALLPAVTRIVNAFNQLIIDVDTGLNGNRTTIQAFADKVADVAQYVAVAWREFPTIVELGKLKIQEFTAQVAEVAERLGTGIWDNFKTGFENVITVMKNNFVPAVKFLDDLFMQLATNIAIHLENALRSFGDKGKAVLTAISPAAGLALEALGGTKPREANEIKPRLDFFDDPTRRGGSGKPGSPINETGPFRGLKDLPGLNFGELFKDLPNLSADIKEKVEKLDDALAAQRGGIPGAIPGTSHPGPPKPDVEEEVQKRLVKPKKEAKAAEFTGFEDFHKKLQLENLNDPMKAATEANTKAVDKNTAAMDRFGKALQTRTSNPPAAVFAK